MAYISSHTRPRFAIASPLDVLRALRRRLVKSAKRREIATLLQLEERILDDMGITRGDVIEALNTREDASHALRSLAAKRRFWTRRRNSI